MRLLTTDIYEGAYLLSHGMQLEKLWIKGSNGRRSVVFEFSGQNVDLLRNSYEKGLAESNVIKLKKSISQLKDCMFNLLRAEESRSEAEIPIAASGRRPNHEQSQCITR